MFVLAGKNCKYMLVFMATLYVVWRTDKELSCQNVIKIIRTFDRNCSTNRHNHSMSETTLSGQLKTRTTYRPRRSNGEVYVYRCLKSPNPLLLFLFMEMDWFALEDVHIAKGLYFSSVHEFWQKIGR